MGDRLAIVDIGRQVGAAVPLYVGELGPHLTLSPGTMFLAYLRTNLEFLIHPTV